MIGLYITMAILGPLIHFQNYGSSAPAVYLRIMGLFMWMVSWINLVIMVFS